MESFWDAEIKGLREEGNRGREANVSMRLRSVDVSLLADSGSGNTLQGMAGHSSISLVDSPWRWGKATGRYWL
jgi:hypothetical protein